MSWDALFSLQGHSPYLLGAYGVTLALIGLEALMLWRRSRVRRAAQAAARVDGTAP
ncbi:heme exporter protein CcmD [Achromobacter aegrifaciens]|uniref:heme exporter protein CcmD n=1 Tax=Achromobacter aegrifaciens TaxID=1287736 RepID=UPI0027BAC1E2|nr:heme exporter protein CcmD [Achromobacter aegrifaciens]WLW59625.1 heme exporter protein CcmD [Achromobacter aegrifaciens]